MRPLNVSFAALAAAGVLLLSAAPGVAQSASPAGAPSDDAAKATPGVAWPTPLPALILDQPAAQVAPPTAPAAPVVVVLPPPPPIAPSADLVPPQAAPQAPASVAPPASVMVVLPPPPAIAPAADLQPPAPQRFTLGKELPARLRADKSDAAKADRDAAVKFYDQRDGAPAWVTAAGFTAGAIALMSEIKNADSYGLQASNFRLPTQTFSPGTLPSATDLADAEATLTLAALKYARHARGGRLDPVALTPMFDRKPQLFNPDTVIAELAASSKPGDYVRGLHPTHPQFERLRLKYVAVRSGQSVLPPPAPTPAPAAVAEVQPGKKAAPVKAPPPPPTNAQIEKRLLANLEMWRWTPAFGDTYVQNNIPEFTTRLYRGGKLVHAERIVTGKSDTPTPIFSDEFETVVFRPFWNVPESIKWKELQPQLERGGGAALEKVGLKAAYNGKEVDARSINWSQTDLRGFHVYQPPGTANALGQVKFLFPNKHDVYMHDTPHKSLFNNASRAYSHGCMRVRDPMKFAEMLLGVDKGWSMDQIKKLANDGPDNNEIRLTKKLPIHITYFTTHVDDDGTLKLFTDIYRHEQKIHLGLEGKAHLIEQPAIVADKAPPRKSTQIVQRETGSSSGSAKSQPSSPFESWAKSIFNF